mmetsp:Transcript_25886/g.39164  ORF Transcript_25886/g.39164 Transcript_25886/m.39164 type:complete len:356 (+) Transcript_25886:102-1169(+)|eukprot:CAMPEP_0178894902 /NCGR_PEP_ID=MMETSP0786-20121207/274_1 /TAXON_ID=186022 /ORGANISM="Thalassionema frauenfeldii, Strain CCMP 1798" /LENGTH=355 /DNA_ID=CAMNT_0020565043 /DNA_START=54 /DNA_END=1121 /DNA_ORIENTATION=+
MHPSVILQINQCKFFHSKLCVVDGQHLWSESATLLGRQEAFLLRIRCKAEIIQLYQRMLMKPDALDATATGWVPFNCASDEADDNTMLVLMFQIDPILTLERNRKGVRTLECREVTGMHEYRQDELDDLLQGNQLNYLVRDPCHGNNYLTDMDDEANLKHKSKRQNLFAQWILKTFDRDALCRGVLDVAGGKGELCQALSEFNIQSILLDPDPRCCNNDDLPFEVLSEPLEGDGIALTDRDDSFAEKIRSCGLIAGMHPDEATEAIIDTALRLETSFAILPCCVMPKLFPNRVQKRYGHPVRSYSTFCQYLQDKAPNPEVVFQVDYLPFVGRNKIIYYKSPSCSESTTLAVLGSI